MRDFSLALWEGGVQELHSLIGSEGPGREGERALGLIPDVTGHVGRS